MSKPIQVIKIDLGNGIIEVRNSVTGEIIGHDYQQANIEQTEEQNESGN